MITKEPKEDEILHYYNTNKDFKDYVDKDMKAYNRTLEQSLDSPITKEYYKYLIST